MYRFLVSHMRPAQCNTLEEESRARCPCSQEVRQPAELLVGQISCEPVAQCSMFPLLDHPGAQQERLHLPSKAYRLPHESHVGWLSCRYFNRIRRFMDHALVSPPDAVQVRFRWRATTRIAQPAAQHQGDAQVTALVRGGLKPCLP